MIASEFAFLALGLVLGVATGAAIVVVLGSRPPAREVKLTVEHGAVPRRAATLSSDAFMLHGEPARGGPADRRRLDRDAPVSDPPPPNPFGAPGMPGVPVMRAAAAFGGPSGGGAMMAAQIRTTVPSWPASRPSPAIPARPVERDRPAFSHGTTIAERDPSIDALRIQAVLAAQRTLEAGLPSATALLEPRPMTSATDEASPELSVEEAESDAVDETAAIVRILRGDHRALNRVVETLAGDDAAMRRPWQGAVLGLAEALIGRAIERGVLDFPVGNPFWDTFTTSQCRGIAAALAAVGFRFDGVDGWADLRVPAYRDLTAAVAVEGLEPRRIRAWPTQDQIGALYREVTVAADELFGSNAPDLELAAVQDMVGARAADLDLLWRQWDVAGPVLAAPVKPAPATPVEPPAST